MLQVAVFVCVGWVLSVCLHEFGHAIVAYWGGDTSVKDKGYLTLNPLKYTDINLSLILPLFFLLIGGIPLPGAAVYINHHRLRNRWWQSAVSAAGPISSAIVTVLLAIIFKLLSVTLDSSNSWILPALALLIFLEIYVIIINSLPIPSLDGYGAIAPWLPNELQVKLRKYSGPALIFLFMLLWYVQPLNRLLSSLAFAIAQRLGVSELLIAQGFALFNSFSIILLMVGAGFALLLRRLTRKPHERWYEKGNALNKSKKYAKAIAAYDQAIKFKPDYYEAWNSRAAALNDLQRYEEALVSYERASEISPDSFEAWYSKGWTLVELKRYAEAYASFQKIAEIRPGDYTVWYSQGIALEELRRYEEAVDAYDKALKIQPDFDLAWYAWYGKSHALNKLQRYEEAAVSYEKTTKLKPDYYIAWLGMGIVLDKLQRYKEALSTYDKAIKIDRENYSAWFYKGYALCQMQQYEEAIACFDKVIELYPEYACAWYNKACCYAEQNNAELAIESLNQVLILDSDNLIEQAKTDSSFDSIRSDYLFQQLINTDIDSIDN